MVGMVLDVWVDEFESGENWIKNEQRFWPKFKGKVG